MRTPTTFCFALTFYVGTMGMIGVSASRPAAGWAQTLPGSVQPQQNPGAITTPTIQPFSAPTSGLPSNIVTPSTTNQLAPSTGPSTSFEIPKTFGSAGRGLPGMAGGPPIKSPMGAQDPTADYMRPPVVGPLFCDPAINIPC